MANVLLEIRSGSQSLMRRDDARIYAALIAVGALMSWLSANHPAAMPVWMPWDFSWPEYLAAASTTVFYLRGLALLSPQEKPPAWRRCAFFFGVASVYAVLQTHYDYMAQHMFFLNRAQHVVMHHLGPFLIALGWPGAAIGRGAPRWVHRVCQSRSIAATMRVLQQPIVAVVLFVGSFFFWLIPAVHFHAMLDIRLYAIMNWTMVLDGLLFWFLVLDPRPKPMARVGYPTRLALAVVVMFPQILLGALIAFSAHDLYPYYDLCGRLYPSVSALRDQHNGGLIIWIPPGMMSAIAVLFVLSAFFRHEEATAARRAARSSPADSVGAGTVLALAILATLLPSNARAQSIEAGVTIQNPWVRFVISARPAAGYFSLLNNSDHARVLVGASSPDCGTLMLHQSRHEGGQEQMVMVERVVVPPHGQIEFAPGGYHLMCMSPSKAVAVGRSIEMTLRFDDGGTATASFPVRGVSGQ